MTLAWRHIRADELSENKLRGMRLRDLCNPESFEHSSQGKVQRRRKTGEDISVSTATVMDSRRSGDYSEDRRCPGATGEAVTAGWFKKKQNKGKIFLKRQSDWPQTTETTHVIVAQHANGYDADMSYGMNFSGQLRGGKL